MEEADDALCQAVRSLDRHLADRRIEILHSWTWYFTGNTPDLQKVARGWEAKLTDALARGHDGLRVAASVPRLKAKDREQLFDYEARLNGYLADKAMLVLCAYPFAVGRAADVARTHPSVVMKRDGKWEAR